MGLTERRICISLHLKRFKTKPNFLKSLICRYIYTRGLAEGQRFSEYKVIPKFDTFTVWRRNSTEPKKAANIKGPKTEPCETPDGTETEGPTWFNIFANIMRDYKYDHIHRKRPWLRPRSDKKFSKLVCCSESKADRSRQKLLDHWSCKLIKAVVVDHIGRYACWLDP